MSSGRLEINFPGMKMILSAGIILSAALAAAETKRQNPPLEAPYTRSNSSPSTPVVIENPDYIDEDTGDYYYKPEEDKEALLYKTDALPPIRSSVFIRFGVVSPFQMESGGVKFEDVYGDSNNFLFYAEYERLLGKFGGQWFLKLGTGLTTVDGKGRFASGANAGIAPKEKFNLYAFPNTAMLNYKIRISDTQWITPYVEGGGGYFTYIESRDDSSLFKFDEGSIGGAAVLSVSAGFLISISQMDKNSIPYFYEEYGIKQLWLDLQFRRNQGLDSEKDFSSNMITGGFGFAY